MFKLFDILQFYVFTVYAISSTYGQECPPNEMPAECEDSCNRCDSDGLQYCPMQYCVPGCQCLPGYTRDLYMNCIPRQFCPPGYSRQPQLPQYDRNSQEVRRILEWEDNRKGCPNEVQCQMNCKQGGMSFRDGLCTGPNKKHCVCYSSRVYPPSIPPSPIGVVAPPTDCPNLSKCIINCERRGYKEGGQCTGSTRNKCECIGDGKSPLRGEDSPLLGLLSPNTVRGGCPSHPLCINFCRGRGFTNGVCLGPRKEYCNCLSRLSGPNSSPNSGSGLLNPGSGLLNPGSGLLNPGSGLLNPGSGSPNQRPGLPGSGPCPGSIDPSTGIRGPCPGQPNTRPGLPNPGSGLPGLPGPGSGCSRPGCSRPPNGGSPNTGPGSSGCPDIAKCVIGCTKSGKSSGFCSGDGRRTCSCF